MRFSNRRTRQTKPDRHRQDGDQCIGAAIDGRRYGTGIAGPGEKALDFGQAAWFREIYEFEETADANFEC
jgi:hypothetical protein